MTLRALSLAGLLVLAGCGSNGFAVAPIGGPPACNTTNIINGTFNFDWTCWAQAGVSGGTIPGFPQFTINTAGTCVTGQSGNPYASIAVPGGADAYIAQQFVVHGIPHSVAFRVWGTQDPVTITVGIVFPVGLHEGTEVILDRFVPPSVQTGPTTCSGLTPITKSYSFSQFSVGSLVQLRLHETSNGVNGAIANFDDVISSP